MLLITASNVARSVILWISICFAFWEDELEVDCCSLEELSSLLWSVDSSSLSVSFFDDLESECWSFFFLVSSFSFLFCEEDLDLEWSSSLSSFEKLQPVNIKRPNNNVNKTFSI